MFLNSDVAFKVLGLSFVELALGAIASCSELKQLAEDSGYLTLISSCAMKLTPVGYLFKFPVGLLYYYVEYDLENKMFFLRSILKS